MPCPTALLCCMEDVGGAGTVTGDGEEGERDLVIARVNRVQMRVTVIAVM